ATKLHNALKYINKCIYSIATIAKPNLPPDVPHSLLAINKHLTKALQLAQLPPFSLTSLALSALPLNSQDTYYTATLKHIKKLNRLYGKVEMQKYTYNNQKKLNSTPT
ncbi:9940_t:CDS:1, partial [Gigaspora rosea]